MEGRRFDPPHSLFSTCQSVLEQDTEPPPNDAMMHAHSVCVCVCVYVCGGGLMDDVLHVHRDSHAPKVLQTRAVLLERREARENQNQD